jgi:pilus assembly protein CpaB
VNKRFASVLVFAVVVAAVASLVFYRLIARVMATAAKPVTTKVIVATRTLQVGSLIRDVDVKSADWAGAVPPQAVNNMDEVVNRGVLAVVYEGEPIIASRLAPKGAGAGLAATIPPGMRAVAVRVNEVVGVAGFVVPGMRVDVLIFGTPPQGGQASGTRARTILQNVQVLSAGQNIQKDAEGKPIPVQVVNLLVTPEDAEILSLASTEARIQLVLRNPMDNKEAKTPGTAMAALFSGKVGGLEPASGEKRIRPRVIAPPPVLAKPKPVEPIIVEVLNGGQRSEAKFVPREDKP